MQYLVLLYGEESLSPQPGTPEWDADMEGYMAFGELADKAIVTGDALWDNSRVRTVRHDGGKVRVTNGPFAETTEGLGGYYVLDAPSLDDAIELVRHIPAVTYGGGEIRPMVQHFDASDGRPEAPAGTARWIATIQGPETDADQPGSAGWDAGMAAHGAFVEGAGDAVYGGGAVHPASTATTVRVRDGELLVTDGPYAETMEMVGGYYLIAGTPEAAAEVAGSIPVNEGGRVELREIMELG
jgi:hypothetical protein